MPSLIVLLAPLFGAILLGLAAGAARIFDQADARTFSRFVFSVAMPVAVFNFMRNSTPPDWSFAGLLAAYGLSLILCVSLLVFLARRLQGISVRQTGAAVFASTCGNAVFLGLPIAISIPEWGVPFLMLMICEGLFCFAIGTALITWPESGTDAPNDASNVTRFAKSILTAFGRVFRNPIIIGHLLGTILAFAQINLPDIISGPVDLFGGIASPFGLFVLGLYLAIMLREQAVLPVKLLSWTLPIKLLVFPLVTAALTWLFTADPTFTAVATLFTMMPPAVASVVLAASYGQYEREVAAIVGIGTAIGLITTTVFLGISLSG